MTGNKRQLYFHPAGDAGNNFVMQLPVALAPLRHPLFRMLWTTNVVVSLGVWMQNTGAGWLMTTLAPDALSVSLVQAATILPIFLLALPAGALADILDRRRFILGTQGWMLTSAVLLAVLTWFGLTGPTILLALTFAIGVGTAMNSPAWGSVMAESVPRHDLVQAIALNGVGFNIARAVGPAIAGLILVFGGPSATFALNAISYLAVVAALLTWRRRKRSTALPPEHLLGAIRAGMRFVRHSPAMRAAMLRSALYYAPSAAPWAMLPLVVREILHLDAGIYGLLLGLMGAGGVAAGLLLPQIRRRLDQNAAMLGATCCSAVGLALLAVSHHWLMAALAMVIFGVGWVIAGAVAQGAAQLASPPWVRSRALAIYQLASNGGLVIGTFICGTLGNHIGLPATLLAAAVATVVCGVATRRFDLGGAEPALPGATPDLPGEAVASELRPVLESARGRVLEIQRYRVAADQREAFLSVMAELREVRGRAGALLWQLYEDVSHAESWLELWSVESWVDHLREATRLSPADRAVLAQAHTFLGEPPAAPGRYLAITPRRPPADPDPGEAG